MNRSIWGFVLLLSTRAHATPDPDPTPQHPEEPKRFGIALVESVTFQAIIAALYYNQTKDENVDADLEFDADSWARKLSFDAVRFDTNPFHVNAVRHPLMSMVHYEIGRSNGFGMLGATLLATSQAIVWEYFVEYTEYPSINDLVIGSLSGMQIAEPLYQIGQLWRGGVLTVGDRVKTAMFSPFDGAHDAVRSHQTRWWRPRAWRTITGEIGGLHRDLDDEHSRSELTLTGDIDIVNDPRYLMPGPQHHRIEAGTWSRIRGRLQLGESGSSGELVGVNVESRTAIGGIYQHDEHGNSRFLGAGAGFSYHRDLLAEAWDHVALFHLLGPQLQLAHRRHGLAVRWDAGAYGDFALIDAHVFAPGKPFPDAPPYLTTVQTEGYYDGAGITGTMRLRVDTASWALDAEASAHQIWQLDFGDRVQDLEARSSKAQTAHGLTDTRIYWRAQLGYRLHRYGVAATAEGSELRGTWDDLEQRSSTLALGLLAQVCL